MGRGVGPPGAKAVLLLSSSEWEKVFASASASLIKSATSLAESFSFPESSSNSARRRRFEVVVAVAVREEVARERRLVKIKSRGDFSEGRIRVELLLVWLASVLLSLLVSLLSLVFMLVVSWVMW